MKFKTDNELVYILCLSLVLAITTVFTSSNTLRAILGLPFVLLFPGYLLTAAIFPGKKDLSGIERLILSFGLSITVVPMLCYALNFSSWGITLCPVVTILLLFIGAMSALAWQRRKNLPEDSRLKLTWKWNPDWVSWFKTRKLLHGGLVVAILFALAAAIYAGSTPIQTEQFTEFYILGQAGTAAGYPDIVNAGDEVAVTVGIINNEHIKTGYRLEVAIDNNLVHSVSPITLGNGEAWEKEVTFKPGMPGKKIKGEFSLFKLGKPEKTPYRKLYIWMDVKNNDTTNSI